MQQRPLVEGASRHLTPHELNNKMNEVIRFILTPPVHIAIEGLNTLDLILSSFLNPGDALEIVLSSC